MGEERHQMSPEDFDVLAICGTGAYGRVLMVRAHADENVYAMKCVDKTNIVQRGQVSITQAIAENDLLQSMDHPFVVGLHWSFQDAQNLYMILDYAGGGDLFRLIDQRRRLPEDWVRHYAAELILAVQHCHEQGIVYRDLKPENVMVGLDGHMMLTDFGLAKRIGDPKAEKPETLRTRTVCGTPSYMAPEALSGKPYGFSVDWWTLGCLIYEMAVGNPPFSDDTLSSLVRRISSGEYRVPGWLSPDLASLIRGFIHLDPSVRLGGSAGGLARVQRHVFFQGIDWDKLARKEIPAPYVPGGADSVTGGSEPNGAATNGATSAALQQQLESGFRSFGEWVKPPDQHKGVGARAKLDGLSLETDLEGKVKAVSSRLARLFGLVSNMHASGEVPVDALKDVVGSNLADIPILDDAARAKIKETVASVAARARALYGESDTPESELPEIPQLLVTVWPKGSSKTGKAAEINKGEEDGIADAISAGARVLRFRFEVLGPSEDELPGGPKKRQNSVHSAADHLQAATGAKTSKSRSQSKFRSHGSGSSMSAEAHILVFAVDRTDHELALALVRRRYLWAYEQRRPGEDLRDEVMSKDLVFEESSTKASLSVTAGKGAAPSGLLADGFAQYIHRRDRFITAFPNIRRRFVSMDVSDDGTQVLTHWEWEGTHSGEYIGVDYDGTKLILEPTQANVICSGVSIDGVRDGLIVRHMVFYDEAALRAQITKVSNAVLARDGTIAATRAAADAIGAKPTAPPLAIDAAVALIDEACGDGLTLVDTSQSPARVLYVNKAFEAMTGYTSQELMASPAGLRILGGDLTSMAAAYQFEEAYRDNKPARILVVHYTKDRRPYVSLCAVAPCVPSPGLIAAWRARSIYSSALAAEAVAEEAMHSASTPRDVDDDDQAEGAPHSERTEALLEAARTDARLLELVSSGKMFTVAHLDMTHVPVKGAMADAAGKGEGSEHSAASTSMGSDDVPDRTTARKAFQELQPKLLGVPYGMGTISPAVRKLVEESRKRDQVVMDADGFVSNGEEAFSPRARRRGATATPADTEPNSNHQLLLRTCVECKGYCIVVSEMCSRDQPLVYINPGFEDLTEYSPLEAIGHNCRFLQSNVTDPGAVMLLKWSIASAMACRVQLLNVTRKGRTFWNLLSMHPCVEQNGRCDYFLGVQCEMDAGELAAVMVEVNRWQNEIEQVSAATA
mmetsp:Transcript_15840/g.42610  ORF Transcript_15840/g.42610 Transcript_15840/m.42610 type:complete len:1194 (+) Transcript_15840:107-3688(+)